MLSLILNLLTDSDDTNVRFGSDSEPELLTYNFPDNTSLTNQEVYQDAQSNIYKGSLAEYVDGKSYQPVSINKNFIQLEPND